MIRTIYGKLRVQHGQGHTAMMEPKAGRTNVPKALRLLTEAEEYRTEAPGRVLGLIN